MTLIDWGAGEYEHTARPRAMAQATGRTMPRCAWYDPEVVAPLAARHGAQLRVQDGELAIVGASPEAYLADGELHPMNIAGRPLLEDAGVYADARAQALTALREGNEDPEAFRVTSPYRVLELIRRP